MPIGQEKQKEWQQSAEGEAGLRNEDRKECWEMDWQMCGAWSHRVINSTLIWNSQTNIFLKATSTVFIPFSDLLKPMKLKGILQHSKSLLLKLGMPFHFQWFKFQAYIQQKFEIPQIRINYQMRKQSYPHSWTVLTSHNGSSMLRNFAKTASVCPRFHLDNIDFLILPSLHFTHHTMWSFSFLYATTSKCTSSTDRYFRNYAHVPLHGKAISWLFITFCVYVSRIERQTPFGNHNDREKAVWYLPKCVEILWLDDGNSK